MAVPISGSVPSFRLRENATNPCPPMSAAGGRSPAGISGSRAPPATPPRSYAAFRNRRRAPRALLSVASCRRSVRARNCHGTACRYWRNGRVPPISTQAGARRAFHDLADQSQRARVVVRPMLPVRTRFPIGHVIVTPILPGELSIEQRLPNLLRLCRDVGHVNELRIIHHLLPQVAS